MKKTIIIGLLSVIGFWLNIPFGNAQQKVPQNIANLKNKNVDIKWKKYAEGWRIEKLLYKSAAGWETISSNNGEYLLLYAKEKPDTTPVNLFQDGKKIDFPEAKYRYNTPVWKEITSPVQMNMAGTEKYFYPDLVESKGSKLLFRKELPQATIQSTWQLDAAYPTDIVVEITMQAKVSGYFSMASPTLLQINQNNLAWATLPGFYQGNSIGQNFVNAYAYGHGIPDKPVLARERTATALAPMITNKQGFTLAAIAQPGVGRNPWDVNKNTHKEWLLGLSLMNRKGNLSPTLYHPVLGESKSWLNAGDKITFGFRFSLQKGDWFSSYKHVVNNIYKFDDFLTLKNTKESLTSRILNMYKYSLDDNTSKWLLKEFKGDTLGAQAYLGGVLDSKKDAMKNSDYGAMWMMGHIMDETDLKEKRLPYARKFKVLQQQREDGFFKGAAAGQYYLYEKKKFTEEWGDYAEPIGLSYYVIMDVANILLFKPEDKELKDVLRLGADRLLNWMDTDGQWKVAYDHKSTKPLFTELQDFRPTFYGLLVAYKLLGDKKYLEGAIKGAQWYVKNAVDKGYFLGVCGDNRFAPDFATAQSAQALLDLYEVTQQITFKDAAIKVAKFYLQSIYTHPIPSKEVKKVKGKDRFDWQISQVGLSFEHGGSIGSANGSGPILLASHAGLFVRIYELTKEPIFLSMARAAVWGRDAFVDPKTHVASYYWQAMDNGPGAFPHHAWWQIGFLTDYLLSEISLRSAGKITFPSGIITPKVGPHKSYGFKPGVIFGSEVDLFLKDGLVNCENPRIDYLTAKGKDGVYLLLLNNSVEKQVANFKVVKDKLPFNLETKLKVLVMSNVGEIEQRFDDINSVSINLSSLGLKTIKISAK